MPRKARDAAGHAAWGKKLADLMVAGLNADDEQPKDKEQPPPKRE